MDDAVRIDWMTERDFPAVAATDPSMGVEQESLEAERQRPWSRRWVAREHGDVVGFAIAWYLDGEMLLLNFATRADRRRRGIGAALLRAIVDYARAHATSSVLLEVRRSNAEAMRLYRAAGFFATGVRAGYYADGEDAVEMRLELDSESREIVRRPDQVGVEA